MQKKGEEHMGDCPVILTMDQQNKKIKKKRTQPAKNTSLRRWGRGGGTHYQQWQHQVPKISCHQPLSDNVKSVEHKHVVVVLCQCDHIPL